MNPAVRHESHGHRFWTSDDPSQNHQAAVARVIHSFHEATSDQPFTLKELSRIAALSRFHFNRVFHRLVGVPPVMFQSLLRLDAARRLLATTDCSVLDISLDLGFQSLGTFTRRFTDAIGMSPSRFRRLAKQIRIERVNSPARPNQRLWSPVVPVARSVSGVVKAPVGFGSGLIFIGLFDSPVPRGHPMRCCVLNRPGNFAISNVEDGDY